MFIQSCNNTMIPNYKMKPVKYILLLRKLEIHLKGLGAIRVKISPTSDVDKIFSKMCSQYVLFRNKYS